nr:MAG: hypothetical protein J07AB56_01390 [Candidatus Nanosalinarum sp. J07AB56]
MEEFERKVREAIDSSTDAFNILQYSQQDIEDATENVTGVLEGQNHDLTYDRIDHWVYTADRRNHDLPYSLHLDAVEHIN